MPRRPGHPGRLHRAARLGRPSALVPLRNGHRSSSPSWSRCCPASQTVERQGNPRLLDRLPMDKGLLLLLEGGPVHQVRRRRTRAGGPRAQLPLRRRAHLGRLPGVSERRRRDRPARRQRGHRCPSLTEPHEVTSPSPTRESSDSLDAVATSTFAPGRTIVFRSASFGASQAPLAGTGTRWTLDTSGTGSAP